MDPYRRTRADHLRRDLAQYYGIPINKCYIRLVTDWDFDIVCRDIVIEIRGNTAHTVYNGTGSFPRYACELAWLRGYDTAESFYDSVPNESMSNATT